MEDNDIQDLLNVLGEEDFDDQIPRMANRLGIDDPGLGFVDQGGFSDDVIGPGDLPNIPNAGTLGGLASGRSDEELRVFAELLSMQGMTAYTYGIFMYFIFRVMRKGVPMDVLDTSLIQKRDTLTKRISEVKDDIRKAEARLRNDINTLKLQSEREPVEAVQVMKGELTRNLSKHRDEIKVLKAQLAQLEKAFDNTLVDVFSAPKPNTLMTTETEVVDGWAKYAESEYIRSGMAPDLPVDNNLEVLSDANLFDTPGLYLSTRFDNIRVTPDQLMSSFRESSIALIGFSIRNNILLNIYNVEGGQIIPTDEAVLLSSISKASLQGEYISTATLDRAIMGKSQYVITPLMLEVVGMNDLIKLGVNPISWTKTTGRALSGFAIQLFELWNGRGRKALTTDMLMRKFKSIRMESTYSLPRAVVTRDILSNFRRKKDKPATKVGGGAKEDESLNKSEGS